MRLALALTLICILAALAFVPHDKPAKPNEALKAQNAELRMENADLRRQVRDDLGDVVVLTCENARLRSRRCSLSLGK